MRKSRSEKLSAACSQWKSCWDATDEYTDAVDVPTDDDVDGGGSGSGVDAKAVSVHYSCCCFCLRGNRDWCEIGFMRIAALTNA